VLDALKGVVFKDDEQVAITLEINVWDKDPPHEGRTLVFSRTCQMEQSFQTNPHYVNLIMYIMLI
jgi:hypothetical protein